MSESLAETELKRLLAAIARGDEAAMAAFYDLTAAKVFGVALAIVKSHELAEEVAMDTFLQVWQAADKYCEEKARPLAWLLMMARSRAIDRLRTLKKTEQECDLADWTELLADTAPSIEEAAAQSERGKIVRECLACLPSLERQKLSLAFFRGLSQAEIATHCAMPLGTVKTYIRNGMARLADLLQQHAGFEF